VAIVPCKYFPKFSDQSAGPSRLAAKQTERKSVGTVGLIVSMVTRTTVFGSRSNASLNCNEVPSNVASNIRVIVDPHIYFAACRMLNALWQFTSTPTTSGPSPDTGSTPRHVRYRYSPRLPGPPRSSPISRSGRTPSPTAPVCEIAVLRRSRTSVPRPLRASPSLRHLPTIYEHILLEPSNAHLIVFGLCLFFRLGRTSQSRLIYHSCAAWQVAS